MEDIEDFDAPVARRAASSNVTTQQRHKITSQPQQSCGDGEFLRPGQARIWVKTFGCSHNVSDGEYMMGQLLEYGYTLVPDDKKDTASAWVINSCTVKNPSQSAMANLLAAGRAAGKAILVAGCVPQGDRRAAELQGLSLLGASHLE